MYFFSLRREHEGIDHCVVWCGLVKVSRGQVIFISSIEEKAKQETLMKPAARRAPKYQLIFNRLHTQYFPEDRSLQYINNLTL
jgi:hypothetical protein